MPRRKRGNDTWVILLGLLLIALGLVMLFNTELIVRLLTR